LNLENTNDNLHSQSNHKLLAARTVLSLFDFGGANGGIGGTGSDANGTVGSNVGKVNFGGHQVNNSGSIVGAHGA
jgi:hypothetical protein